MTKDKKHVSDETPATLGYKDKPLGQWPDSEKHEAVENVEDKGSESISGHQSDPEEITGAEDSEPKDTLDRAKEAGLYSDHDEERPGELGVAEEEEEDLEEERQS